MKSLQIRIRLGKSLLDGPKIASRFRSPVPLVEIGGFRRLLAGNCVDSPDDCTRALFGFDFGNGLTRDGLLLP